MAMTKCPKCGSTEIDSGKMLGAGSGTRPGAMPTATYQYVSDSQKNAFDIVSKAFLDTDSLNWMKTYVCMKCGYFENYFDPEKIRKQKVK